MDRSKFVAYVTGAIALILGIGYLVLVQFLDMRGEMIPAPILELLPLDLTSVDLTPIVDRLFEGFHF